MEHTKKRTWRPAACTALLAVGMAAALYAVLGIFPFGDASVLTGDLNAQYIPYFVHFRRALESGGSFAASDAYNRYPLAVKLHVADLIATYLLEQGTSSVPNGH